MGGFIYYCLIYNIVCDFVIFFDNLHQVFLLIFQTTDGAVVNVSSGCFKLACFVTREQKNYKYQKYQIFFAAERRRIRVQFFVIFARLKA